MAFRSHRGTIGHSIGKGIIGPDTAPGNAGKATQADHPPSEPDITGGSGSEIRRIRLEMHDNGGATVHHEMKGKPGKDGAISPMGEEKSNAFGSAMDAHKHVGKLIGCPDCQG